MKDFIVKALLFSVNCILVVNENSRLAGWMSTAAAAAAAAGWLLLEM